MAVMNRSQFESLLQQGLNTVWGLEYKQYPEEWRKVFDVSNSKKAFEEDQQVTGFGAAMVTAEGSAIALDKANQGYKTRYVHEKVALGFSLTEEAVDDNLYLTLGSKYTKALARSMQHTKEIKGAAILNNAFSVSNGGDGVSLLNASHPYSQGGTWSNILSTPADISETALEDILIMIRKAKDDRGIPIALKAVDVIIPPELEYVTCRLLDSQMRPGTGDNDVNAINKKSIFGREPIVITRLTDADAWFIKTDANDGLRHFVRKGVETKMIPDHRAGIWTYVAKERYAFGFTDPRAVFGSSGAA